MALAMSTAPTGRRTSGRTAPASARGSRGHPPALGLDRAAGAGRALAAVRTLPGLERGPGHAVGDLLDQLAGPARRRPSSGGCCWTDAVLVARAEVDQLGAGRDRLLAGERPRPGRRAGRRRAAGSPRRRPRSRRTSPVLRSTTRSAPSGSRSSRSTRPLMTARPSSTATSSSAPTSVRPSARVVVEVRRELGHHLLGATALYVAEPAAVRPSRGHRRSSSRASVSCVGVRQVGGEVVDEDADVLGEVGGLGAAGVSSNQRSPQWSNSSTLDGETRTGAAVGHQRAVVGELGQTVPVVRGRRRPPRPPPAGPGRSPPGRALGTPRRP